MQKRYYTFNPETNSYEPVHTTFAQKVIGVVRKVLMFIIFGGLAFLVFYLFIDKPTAQDFQNDILLVINHGHFIDPLAEVQVGQVNQFHWGTSGGFVVWAAGWNDYPSGAAHQLP